MPQGFKIIAALAARAADDKKGEGIVLLDVHRSSGLTDFILIVSVNSPAHLEAIENEIDRVMESSGVHALHRDGSESGLWRVVDYGGIMVHLMHPEAREFYQIEKLYHDAPRKHWQPPEAKAARGKG